MLKQLYNIYNTKGELIFTGINTECEERLRYRRPHRGARLGYILSQGGMLKCGRRRGIRVEATGEYRECYKKGGRKSCNHDSKAYALYDRDDNLVMVGTRDEIAKRIDKSLNQLSSMYFNTRHKRRKTWCIRCIWWRTKKMSEEKAEYQASAVDHPSHYAGNGIECIDAIIAMMSKESLKGFLRGNAIKYLWRYEDKGNAVQDLQKAEWYINKLIEVCEHGD